MNVVIIEDEVIFSDELKRLLVSYDKTIFVSVVLKSIEESLAWFASNEEPDIIFSDIRLQDGSSFEIFKRVRLKCPIVFTTAYDEFAMQAFNYNSIHYLLKPITINGIKEAFEKIKNFKGESDINGLVRQLTKPQDSTYTFLSPRLFVRRHDGLVPLQIDEIAAVQSQDRVVIIHMKDGRELLSDYSMKDLSVRLSPLLFKKISRQWTINITAVEKLSTAMFGKGHIVISPGYDIELSRDKYYDAVKIIMGE